MAKNQYNQAFNQYGQAFGVDPGLLYGIAKLESGFDPNAANDWDSNAKAGIPSKGLMQFIQPTFKGYYAEAAKERPDLFRSLGKRDWMNPEQQIATAAWAISKGKGKAWATYDRAKAYGGKKLPGGAGAPVRAGSGLGDATGTSDPALAFIQSRLAKRRPALAAAIGALQKPAERIGLTDTGSPLIGGAAPKRGKGEDGWKYLQRIAQQKFGLRNDPGDSQTVGGGHMRGSEHYDGRAIDFGTAKNSQKQLQAWLRWARSQGYDAIDENDHIHVSLPGSGI